LPRRRAKPGLPGPWVLDRKTAALVPVGVLVFGLGRAVSAVMDVAAALGYDIDAAREDPDEH
jgi:hypothetical protein